MKRTRKWAYVEQDARRLADLGLAPVEIATRLGVRRQTVQRWMAAGKLTDTRQGGRGQGPVSTGKAPGEWASSVRSSYALDATDEELVSMAETMLATFHDPGQSMTMRMAAMREFRATVKQLALVARSADEKPAEKPAAPRPLRQVRDDVDPRQLLRAVN